MASVTTRPTARWWSVETVTRGIAELETFVAEADGELVGTAVLGRLGDVPVPWKLHALPERTLSDTEVLGHPRSS